MLKDFYVCIYHKEKHLHVFPKVLTLYNMVTIKVHYLPVLYTFVVYKMFIAVS